MAKIPVDVKQMAKFAKTILGRIGDTAAKKKTSQQIQVAVNKAIAAGRAGDQTTVDKIFANLQNAAKKPAKTRAPKKGAAAKPAAAVKPAAKPESRTPRLDKIAEGAKPMDEAMRVESKADALEKMSRDVVSEDDYAEWAARTGADERADDELLNFSDEGVGAEPSRTLGGPKDKTVWTPTGRKVTVTKEERKTAAELSSKQLDKIEGQARAIANKRQKDAGIAAARERAKQLNEAAKAAGKPAPSSEEIRAMYVRALKNYSLPEGEWDKIYKTELARLEKELIQGKGGELVADETKFVSARRFSNTEQRAIAKRNKNLRRGGKPEMTADEEDEFVKNLRNPKGEVRRFSSMPKMEKKDLPEPKTTRERFEGKQEGESFAESLKKRTPAPPRKKTVKVVTARVGESVRNRAQGFGRKARAANKGKNPSSDKAFKAYVESLKPKRPDGSNARELIAWKKSMREYADLQNELRKEWLNGWNT